MRIPAGCTYPVAVTFFTTVHASASQGQCVLLPPHLFQMSKGKGKEKPSLRLDQDGKLKNSVKQVQCRRYPLQLDTKDLVGIDARTALEATMGRNTYPSSVSQLKRFGAGLLRPSVIMGNKVGTTVNIVEDNVKDLEKQRVLMKKIICW